MGQKYKKKYCVYRNIYNIYVCVCVYIHMYIYIYIYIHTHTVYLSVRRPIRVYAISTVHTETRSIFIL